jgi:predicted nucleic acid-binding protein
MLNIHDTRDIKLQHVVLRGHRKGEDALHAAYVKKLRLSECSIFDSSHDALDLEFSKAVLDNLTIVGAGEEGVDVMGGKVTVRNAAIIGCGENAVSAGEESRVALVDSVLAHGNCGVLAKNASRVRIEGSLLYRLQTGVEVHRYSDRYDGRARVKSDLLHVVECEVNAVAEKGGLEKVVALDESWPPADLEELESRVLKISHWDDFDYALERLRGAVQ